MRITVCELSNDLPDLERDWAQLVTHVKSEDSRLILLPEMPFYPWVAWTRQVDPAIWQRAVAAHDEWISRLLELAPATVLGSRPVIAATKHLNEGFIWESGSGYRAIHHKYYLPDEERFWEASWYERGEKDFTALQSGEVGVGCMICTELWFTEQARVYGKAGVHLIANPRATELFSVEKWIVGGRAAAITSGAFCLSSNRGGLDKTGIKWGGAGWIIDPDGEVLATTSRERPFLTLDIDLSVAERAKQTYPRYVLE